MKLKKIIALLLTFLLCFSLCACTSGKTNIKNEADFYIGEWETSHFRLTINKGGVGRYEEKKDDGGYWDFNWEIDDSALVIRINSLGTERLSILQLSDDTFSLSVTQNGFPTSFDGEDIFYKTS